MSKRNILINIHGQPPTQAELDRAKKQILKTQMFFLTAFGLSIILTLYALYADNWGYYRVILLVCSYLLGALAYIVNKPTTRDFDLINPEKYPEECLEYSKFLSDPVVSSYHSQIISQGRVPVILEYLVAKAWVKSASKREKQALAKAAFAKITTKERVP